MHLLLPTGTYTHIYIHVHTNTYTYLHTYTYTYIYTHIHTYTYTDIHTYIHTHTHIHSSCTPVAWVNLCDPKSLQCIVATSTIGSCSLLCAAMGTVLCHHTALGRSQTLCACFVHAINKPRGWVLKVVHWEPLLSDSFHCIPKSFLET